MTEINTLSGPIEIVHQVTLGDVLIVTAVSLLILLHLIKWLLDTIWGRNR